MIFISLKSNGGSIQQQQQQEEKQETIFEIFFDVPSIYIQQITFIVIFILSLK